MSVPLSLLPLALLGRLPLCCRRRLGKLLGDLARLLITPRRRIAQRNLALAFPHLPPPDRQGILRQHFRLLGATLLDECALLTMSKNKLRQFITIEHENTLKYPLSLILVSPHFVGMSVAGVRVSTTTPANARMPHYLFHHKPLRNRFWNTFYRCLRERWRATNTAATKASSMRKCVRHLQNNGCLYYLPDIDPKARKSTVFVPFLGVTHTATTTAVGRLAAMTGARVALCVTTMTARGYEVRLELVTDFPTADAGADTARINRLIETSVRAHPAQYYWLHRRFKTRPAGEKNLYD